jgi:hypothetical protein
MIRSGGWETNGRVTLASDNAVFGDEHRLLHQLIYTKPNETAKSTYAKTNILAATMTANNNLLRLRGASSAHCAQRRIMIMFVVNM